MKRFYAIALLSAILMFTPMLACAKAVLVCDPVDETTVTHYHVILDTVDMGLSPAFYLGDGTVRLNYDLTGVAVGNHHVDVAAYNALWELYSSYVSLDFVKIGPDDPLNLRLEFESLGP